MNQPQVPSLLNLPTSHPIPFPCVVAEHWLELPPSYSKFPLAILYMAIKFPCSSFNLSHCLLHPLCSQVCSLCLHLHRCPTNRFISTISLDPIYMLYYTIFVFLFLTSLCVTGSRFIHLIRTDSNVSLFTSE